MSNEWVAHYPDLVGKTAVVGGVDLAVVRAVAEAFASNNIRLAVVAAERIEPLSDNGYAVVGDVTADGLWARVLPHVEQRLGPIDIAVSIGTTALLSAVAPDMSARGRGVAIQVGNDESRVTAPRRRQIIGGTPHAVATVVLLCASDTLNATDVAVTLR